METTRLLLETTRKVERDSVNKTIAKIAAALLNGRGAAGCRKPASITAMRHSADDRRHDMA
jgi:hypothetical protein